MNHVFKTLKQIEQLMEGSWAFHNVHAAGATQDEAKQTPEQLLHKLLYWCQQVEIFKLARLQYKERNVFLVVAEGHVAAGSNGIIAQLGSDEAAIEALEAAGYTRDTIVQNIVFYP